jgi:serine phosphatase RsbU (regulator of sigma subunit)
VPERVPEPLPTPDQAAEACDPRRLDACLSTRELLSLDPVEVAEAAGKLIAEAMPAARVTLVTLGERRLHIGPPLDEIAQALIHRCHREGVLVRDSSDGTDYLAIPLISDAADADALQVRVVGVVVLAAKPGEVKPGDLELATMVADRAALALAHAALYQTQAAIAQRVQRLLVPLEPPFVEDLEIGTFFRSRTTGAEIGGDFYDFAAFSPGQVSLAIGDVSGKGVEAGSVTIMTKYALRALVRTSRWPPNPGEILRDLHNALQDQLDPSRFVTVTFAHIDAVRRTMTVSTAGHPAPIIVRAGRIERPLLVPLPPIAVTDDPELEPYPTERLELSRGDTVVFLTDGIAELRDARGRFYDEARLAQVLDELRGLSPQELVQRLAADAAAFSARAPADDIAIVAVRLV